MGGERMARPINYELRDRVLEFIKKEYYKIGGPISLSLASIAQGVGENPKYGEKIMRIVDGLERSGYIRVYRGQGSAPNTYEFLSDISVGEIVERKEQINETLDVLISNVNESIKEVFNFAITLSKENIELKGEIAYLINALSNLEVHGHLTNGILLFRTTNRNSTLPLILEEIKSGEVSNNNSNKEEL